MLIFEEALAASCDFQGGLGAIVYASLMGMEKGGADESTLAEVGNLLFAHFAGLSDEDCNVLCRVVFERLSGDRLPDGTWYA